MTRNDFVLQVAKMILDDWRTVLINNKETKGRLALPGDLTDISFRAFQKAYGIADAFYIPEEDVCSPTSSPAREMKREETGDG